MDDEIAGRYLALGLAVVKSLKRGDCWCEVAIGNPNLAGVHTPQCVNARRYVEQLEKWLEVDA